MIKFFKRLFRRKKITYMYIVNYHDYFAGKTHSITVPSQRILKDEYPKLYGGIMNTVTILFVYEE